MSAILGPAYPALLAFGAPVVVRSADGGMYPAVYITADGGGVLVCTTLGTRYLKSDDALDVDYADPYTRDRVARALWLRLRRRAYRDFAPQLWCWSSGGEWEWVLGSDIEGSVTFRAAKNTRGDGARCVPALADIDRRDRHAAKCALRAVAAAVWGPR